MMPTLASWLHDWSPFLVQFTQTAGVRWYGLAYIGAFVYAYLVLTWLSRRGVIAIPTHRVLDAMVVLVVGVIAGGRVGYVLLYEPALLTQFSSSFPYWSVLRFAQGGMAFHGGLVGVILACWWISRGFRDQPSAPRTGKALFLHTTDTMAFVCTVGLGLGRVANFINGELLGKIVALPGQPAPWWSVKFPQELLLSDAAPASHRPPLSPPQQAQLDEALRTVALPSDDRWSATERLITTLQSGSAEASARVARQIEPLLSARHPSQLYQAFFEGVLLTALVWIMWRTPKRAGVLSACFLLGYAATRIFAELYRLPDAHLAVARPLGLSRGQWFSVAMVVVAAMVLAVALRKGRQVVGGWSRAGK